MKTDLPRTIYLKDYTPPSFLISNTELDVALSPSQTNVKARLSLHPNPKAKGKSHPLKLDGELLSLSVWLSTASNARVGLCSGGERLSPSTGTVPSAPFTLEIETICDPEANKALTRLYRSQGVYCTQCEAEGFRRITYYLDRPDVLSKFRVRIEADRKDAPILLSNGNLVGESGEAGPGRHFAVWEDPFAKPSYLFALVAGKLGMVQDSFTTRSGRKVDLRIYVSPVKRTAAPGPWSRSSAP